MSSSYITEPGGRITLTSRNPDCKYEVKDSAFRSILPSAWQDFVSDFSAVPPGVYHCQARIGSNETSRTILVGPGDAATHDLDVAIECVAPVADQAREDQASLAVGLSSEVASIKDGSAIVLVLMSDYPAEPESSNVEILDEDQQVVLRLDSESRQSDDRSAVGRHEILSPGPYILRTARRGYPYDLGRISYVDQTIWLFSGWQTLVFLLDSASGPLGEEASIHMCPAGRIWGTTQYELRQEIELLQLKSRVPATRRDSATRLDYPPSPITMISLITRLRMSLELADNRQEGAIIPRLLNILGGFSLEPNPDLVTILWSADSSYSWYGQPREVTWPPMLQRSWATALELGAQGVPVLSAGTPGERVASSVISSWPWLQWLSTVDLKSRTTGSIKPPAEAVGLVRRIIRDINSFDGNSSASVALRISSAELAARASLPQSLVDAALHELGVTAEGR